MTRQQKINVMASYLWDLDSGDWWVFNDAADLPRSITYDEPIGACDGSQWIRHELTCSDADWADAGGSKWLLKKPEIKQGRKS